MSDRFSALKDLCSARFFKRTLWETHRHVDLPAPVRAFYGLLRFVAIVWHGITHNRTFGNAAALSYSMLIALGPMIAVVVMISGFLFQDTESSAINDVLNNMIGFISTPATLSVDSATGAVAAGEAQVNPEVVGVIEHLIESARSGAVGLVGSLVLIVISIQLITTVEQSLNLIWGVKRGRTFAQRVIFYWSFLSLGTILGLAAVALLSASTAAQFADNLPFGETLLHLIRWGAPILSFGVIVLLLGSFYRFMPNTFVQWRAALGGAALAALLLFLNKELSFIYVSRVIRAQSLYGSIGIIPVFMFGLYVFWIFILVGGQVSYALQNLSSATSLRAWENLSADTREALSLGALVLIARRFRACEAPPSVDEISDALGVPQKILNRCLGMLVEANLINPVEEEGSEALVAARYQPARPLERISLGYFKAAVGNLGHSAGTHLLEHADPLVSRYRQCLKALYAEDPDLSKNLEILLAQTEGTH